MNVRPPARAALAVAGVILIVEETVGGNASDGYANDFIFGLFVAAPLLILAVCLSRAEGWALGQAAVFLAISVGAIVWAEIESHSSSTAGLWGPTVAALKYALLFALGITRLVRRLIRLRGRSVSAT